MRFNLKTIHAFDFQMSSVVNRFRQKAFHIHCILTSNVLNTVITDERELSSSCKPFLFLEAIKIFDLFFFPSTSTHPESKSEQAFVQEPHAVNKRVN